MIFNLVLIYDRNGENFQLIKESQIGKNYILIRIKRFNKNVYDVLNSNNKSLLIFFLENEFSNLTYLSNVNKLVGSRIIFCYTNFFDSQKLKFSYPNSIFVPLDLNFFKNLDVVLKKQILS